MQLLELWGGHECTVNRVGDQFFDQTRRTGHQDRPGDLDLFAELGVRSLRYPVLWERVAPDAPDRFDWSWTDERLGRLRELGINPIVGLVHHGSGPRYTNLLDDGFAQGVAAFAARAAERYDWVQDWTPVNEPLTTARFSALYGHWYPHLADEAAFWAALLNQIDAVRLAMREVRRVNPQARLVQTEDLGRTYATRAVAYQAGFDNQRRWMTWDLLCGWVTADHPMWERLHGFGLADRLRAIADDPCPPDIVGVNHYLTSDRFLDHRVEHYPPERCGGNDMTDFADVEAIRVLQPAPYGLEGALREAWERYRLPVALTECHNGCTRDEQMRWFLDAWDAAQRLRDRGVEIRAVTAWSLLGSYDWNSLLVRPAGRYEVGVFDVSAGEPRPTAMAGLLKRIAAGKDHGLPAACGSGWWRRDIRLQFQPVFRSVDTTEPRLERRTPVAPSKPLLIAGATGTLGKALARAAEWRGLDYVLTSREQLPLHDEAAMARALETFEPWAVINAAGWVRVDDAEAEPDGCLQANAVGAAALARACTRRGVSLVSFSSDLVFDGCSGVPYVESDAPNPLNVYGRSKAEAEQAILKLGGRNLIVRTAAFFSPYDPYNFASHLARALSAGQQMAAASDLAISPTYVPDLVDATLDLLIDGETGIWHLANEGVVTWAEFGVQLAEALGLDPRLVRPTPAQTFRWPAPRPMRAPLASERGRLMPRLDNAIDRYAALVRAAEFAAEAEAAVDGSLPARRREPLRRPEAS